MLITSAQFIDAAQTRTEFIVDGATVQEVGGGKRDQRILDWIAAGNKPDPFVPPPAEKTKTKSERIAAMLGANGLTLADLKAELSK
jgi:hypothetical protein